MLPSMSAGVGRGRPRGSFKTNPLTTQKRASPNGAYLRKLLQPMIPGKTFNRVVREILADSLQWRAARRTISGCAAQALFWRLLPRRSQHRYLQPFPVSLAGALILLCRQYLRRGQVDPEAFKLLQEITETELEVMFRAVAKRTAQHRRTTATVQDCMRSVLRCCC